MSGFTVVSKRNENSIYTNQSRKNSKIRYPLPCMTNEGLVDDGKIDLTKKLSNTAEPYHIEKEKFTHFDSLKSLQNLYARDYGAKKPSISMLSNTLPISCQNLKSADMVDAFLIQKIGKSFNIIASILSKFQQSTLKKSTRLKTASKVDTSVYSKLEDFSKIDSYEKVRIISIWITDKISKFIGPFLD